MNKIKKFGKYGLPIKVVYCSTCTRSNQRPHNIGEFSVKKNDLKKTVKLGKKNMCAACKYWIEKRKINWNKREKELKKLCDEYRKSNGEYDVIVPGSGGKDSIVVAHELKYNYGMTPLLVTWAPNMITEIGKKNLKNWQKFSKKNIYVKQHEKTHRILTKLAFLNLCHPFQPFILGQKNLAPRIAHQKNIKLVMHGEHDAEFGMLMETKNKPDFDVSHFCSDKDIKDIHISGVKVTDLIDKYNLKLKNLKPYLPLDLNEFKNSNIKFHYFSYYKKWNHHDNYYYALKNSKFMPSDSRIEGSYDKYASMDDKIDWLHFYTFYIKFGMGRATSTSDQEIRSGVITREEGVSLVKRFDGEYPNEYLRDCLNYMGISKSQFTKVIDQSRPRHLWTKKNGKWVLKSPIWKNT